MGLGGNPYGPAGTGKTESVKALGGLFGRQVLVFNCDEVRMKTYPAIRHKSLMMLSLIWSVEVLRVTFVSLFSRCQQQAPSLSR